jgi:pimeloyl-ACP methyl ester carboxylesterase
MYELTMSVQSPCLCLRFAIDTEKDFLKAKLLASPPISLAPGQSRPVGLCFTSRYVDVTGGINITFVYNIGGQQSEQLTTPLKLKFCQRLIHNPHKFTFLHPSGAVSYAILRPPRNNVHNSTFPVLLNLHGAGLESDSHQVRHMLDAAPDLNAWVLFPTGMSPWSGDDWHTWGFADVRAAVSAIPEWIGNIGWVGPGVDTKSWIVTGHSNGGQGAWFISMHQPDKVVATAAVSGYSSIQTYVPYVMWKEASPLADSIIHNSLSSYRHELLVDNLTGVPIYQQHGSEDDNVPPYHSRLLNTLLHESGCSPQYVELPKRGHWFDGAMTTNSLKTFYTSVLESSNHKKRVPEVFKFVVPNSDDIGSRAGIWVDQLQSPDYFGKLNVHRDDEGRIWHIKTTNIRRMHFRFPVSGLQQPKEVQVDEQRIQIPSTPDKVSEIALVLSHDMWEECDSRMWKGLSTRYGRQRGSLDAILRTHSPFRIRMYTSGLFKAALQVSRNLMQYYGGDAEIVIPEDNPEAPNERNTITLVVGKSIPPALIDNFPVQISADCVEIRRPHTNVLKRIPRLPGLGAAFLRPLPDENLELVLWGQDEIGLQQAVRMVPTLTGAGQPDLIVLSDEARWLGHVGVLAMGFFDHAWEISQASYIP